MYIILDGHVSTTPTSACSTYIRTSCEIYIPYVSLDAMLEPISEKLTISNLKLSLLSYNVVVYFPCSIVITISKYEKAVVLSVVFLQ